jgi:integrase
MRLDDYFREWLAGMRTSVRPSTLDSYELISDKYIVPRLGPIELQGLRPIHIKAFYADLLLNGGRDGGQLAPKTVRNVYAVLHRALAEASSLGYISSNPASKAKAPAANSPEMRTWSREEVRAFLDATREDRMYAAWRLALTTGMRRG